jgi:hypothetical protein
VTASREAKRRWRYPGRQPIPPRTRVWVRSVSGIECEAVISVYGMRRVWTIKGVDRVHCWRRDTKSESGDLWVIAWKPLT